MMARRGGWLAGGMGLLGMLLILGTLPAPAAENGGRPEAQAQGEDGGAPGPVGTGPTCPCTFGPIITDTAVPVEKGKFVVQPTSSLSFTGASLSPNWRRVSAGGNFLSFRQSLKLTYGIFKNSEVYVVLPFVQNWAWGVDAPGPNGERAASFGGLGDIVLVGKYMFVEDKDLWPAISAFAAVSFPSGHHAPLNPGRLGTDQLGDGSFGFSLGLLAQKWVKPVILYGNLWYTANTTCRSTREQPLLGPLLLKDHKRDALVFNVAAEYPFKGTGPWVGLFEFYSIWEMGPLFGPRSPNPCAAKVGILPGIEYVHSDKLAFALGVGIDVAGKNTDLTYTPVISMLYTF